MNTSFKKTASLFLALLVTLSTFCITVEKHFCGDVLIDISYLGEADSCGIEEDSATSIKKINCCDDEIVHIEGQKKLQKITLEDYVFQNSDFLIPNCFDTRITSLLFTSKTIVFEEYSPPKITPDIQLLQEVFII